MKKLIILLITLTLFAYSCGDDKEKAGMNKNELNARLNELCNKYREKEVDKCMVSFAEIINKCPNYDEKAAVKYHDKVESLLLCEQKGETCDTYKGEINEAISKMCPAVQ